MALVPQYRPWVSKPYPGTLINWAHPLAYGMRVCFPLWEGSGYCPTDIISGRHMVHDSRYTVPQWEPVSGGGMARKYITDQRNDTTDTVPGFSASLNFTGPLSVAYSAYSLTSLTDANWRGFVARRTGTSSTCSFAFNHNNSGAGSIQWFWGTGAAYQLVNFAKDYPLREVVSYCGTRRGTTAGNVTGRLYENGKLLKETGSLNPPVSSTTIPLVLGNSAQGSEISNGHLFYVYIWDRELTAEEVKMVAATPYAFFVPQRTLVEDGGAAEILSLIQNNTPDVIFPSPFTPALFDASGRIINDPVLKPLINLIDFIPPEVNGYYLHSFYERNNESIYLFFPVAANYNDNPVLPPSLIHTFPSLSQKPEWHIENPVGRALDVPIFDHQHNEHTFPSFFFYPRKTALLQQCKLDVEALLQRHGVHIRPDMPIAVVISTDRKNMKIVCL